jgi:transcriptional regulator with XRE-family HTH domain
MAKTTRLHPLKALRERLGLTQGEIACILEVPVEVVAGWERSLEGASALQLRDLAYLLDESVATLRGSEISDAEEAAGTFAAYGRSGVDYGTLKLVFSGWQADYPVDEKAREGCLHQLSSLDIQQDGSEDAWISTWTLDNKLVYANPAFLHQAELISDDSEEMPDYEHPEVYNALEDWELDRNLGPVLKQRCEELTKEDDGEALLQAMQYTRIVMGNGEVTWHFMLEEGDSLGYFVLELEAGSGIRPNRFLHAVTEGYHRARYINLSRAALIEVPANRYFRLLAEGAARESTG